MLVENQNYVSFYQPHIIILITTTYALRKIRELKFHNNMSNVNHKILHYSCIYLSKTEP